MPDSWWISLMLKLPSICWSVAAVVYHIIAGTISSLIPDRFLPKKSLEGELALVTGAGM